MLQFKGSTLTAAMVDTFLTSNVEFSLSPLRLYVLQNTVATDVFTQML